MYFEINQPPWSFRSGILTQTVEVLTHSFIQIVTLTHIKRKILHALKDIHKEFFLYHAGYRGQVSNQFSRDLALITGFIDKYRLFGNER